MKFPNQILLALIVLLTAPAVTFAQSTTVKLKKIGKPPFDTYENVNVIIYCSKDDGSKATAAAKKVLEDSTKRPHPTESEFSAAKTRQFTFISALNNGVGAELLKEGNAAIFDKRTGRFVTEIQYEVNSNYAHQFYFTGSKTPFFNSHDLTQDPLEITDDAQYYPAIDESARHGAAVQSINGEPVYTVVERSPRYPGGIEQLMQYLKTRMRRPNECLGHVYVSFIVDTDGSILEPVVVKSLGPACDAEALRLIRESIKWIPGEQNGKIVKARFVFPVRFRTY